MMYLVRWLVICFAVVTIIFSYSGCSSHNTTGHIVYFKEGKLGIHVDLGDNTPFIVTGGTRIGDVIDVPIMIEPMAFGYFSVEYTLADKKYIYLAPPGYNISDENISIKISPKPGHKGDVARSVYYIRFTDYKPIYHPKGIGYYKEGKARYHVEDKTGICPFKVTGSPLRPDVINIPVYIKLLEEDTIYCGFKVGKNEQPFECRIHSGDSVQNKYLRVKIETKPNLTEAEMSGVYYFQFENKDSVFP